MSEKNQGHGAGNIINFPKRGKMAKQGQGRYGGQTIPLNPEEELLLESLFTWSGIRKATLARSFYYRGIAAYLKDKKLELDNDEQAEIREALRKFIESEPDMRTALRVVLQRDKNSLNNKKKPA